jgi:inorganic pyrophosphatase
MKKAWPSTVPMPGASAMCNLVSFQPRDSDNDTWNVIIETPKGTRNKYSYDEQRGVFKLKKALPLGSVFPFDFGFFPSTLADDGDPLDVLVLMDAATFPGCLVEARLIGVIEAVQTERGKKIRNDRIIGVAQMSHDYQDIRSIKRLPAAALTEIEHFFVSYHELTKKPFKPLGQRGPKHAARIVEEGMQRYFKRLRAVALEQAS